MKRWIIGVLALTAACSEGGADPVRAEKALAASAWVQPPQINGVLRQSDGLVVRGAAAPRSRVVLRAADGAAVAASADDRGRFELRLPPLSGDVLLTPEVQVGEDSAVSPQTLVIIQGGEGPIALIAAGEPTLRLDSHGALDAVDTDGRSTVASAAAGRSAPRQVSIGGAILSPVLTNTIWRAAAPGGGAATIVVNGQAFAFPGGGSEQVLSIQRAGAGWRLTWPIAPDGRQSTWLPDRP